MSVYVCIMFYIGHNGRSTEWRPSSRMTSHGSRGSTRDSKRPTTSELREEERIHRMLAGGPEDTPPGSPHPTDRKSLESHEAGSTIGDAKEGDEETGNLQQQGETQTETEKVGTYLSLYVNGKSAGEIRNISCNLPMKSIGAQEFSFHGCLLDIRYWHKARSAKEIQYYMNRLLRLTDNSSKPLHGLVGWWTFEDGWGEKVVVYIHNHTLTCIYLFSCVHVYIFILIVYFSSPLMSVSSVSESQSEDLDMMNAKEKIDL